MVIGPTAKNLVCKNGLHIPEKNWKYLLGGHLLLLWSLESYVSVNSKPDHPAQVTPGDSHIPVAPGVRFLLLCLAWGFAWGRGLKSKEKFNNFEKSTIFVLSLKQMNSSSFHMFMYAIVEVISVTYAPVTL